MTSRRVLVHGMSTNNSDLFAVLEHFQDFIIRLAKNRVHTWYKDCIPSRLNLYFLSIAWIEQISELFVVYLQISYPYRCSNSFFIIFDLLIHEDVFQAHLQNSLLFIPFNGVGFPSSCLTVSKHRWGVALVNVAKNLFSNIIEDKGVVNRRPSLWVICTPIAPMESKLSNLSIIRIGESDLLVVHLDYVVLALFPFDERPDSNNNFDVVSHKEETNGNNNKIE